MRRALAVIIMVIVITVPFAVFDVLPDIGDPQSAPNTHVSDYYIENAVSECNSPNMVTAVIVDYRAFDTMFETTVMFLAGVCVVMILANKPKRKIIVPRSFRMFRKTGDPIYRTVNKDVMISVIEPIILVYAVYVLFHGEVSLGGGFQAGALIGMTYLLDVMVGKRKNGLIHVTKFESAAVAGVGPFIYALCGILTMLGGGLFLEYAEFPAGVDTAELHSIGILMVEIGVTIGVMGTIITILNALRERIKFDDDND